MPESLAGRARVLERRELLMRLELASQLASASQERSVRIRASDACAHIVARLQKLDGRV